MTALTATITYPNFKSAIYAIPAQVDKSAAIGEIWEVMYEYQGKSKLRRKSGH